MTLSEIRKNARESLTGKWGNAALLMLVYSLIEFGITFIYSILNYIPFLSFFAYIGLIVVSVPISFGLAFCFIEIKKGNNVECIDYFKFGFSNFTKCWSVVGNILKKIWLYVLLYVVLLFAACFTTVFIIAFSVALNSGIVALFGCLLDFILIAAFITVLVLLIIKSYLYVLTPYIMWDNPNMSAKDIVEKSESLMNGHRGSYFVLDLSFIGWAILSVFTFGIGLLWLIPYMQTSFIVFYENRLKEDTDNDNTDNNNKLENNNNPKELEEPVNSTEKSETIENTDDVKEETKPSSEDAITEIDEKDIEKIDILDDNGNIIG